MTDYIKREDAIKIIRESPFKRHTTIICYFVGSLNELPTADVRKNIKAQKVIGGGERDGDTCWFECSHCHGTVDLQDMFCKHCGAVLEYEK